MRYFLGVHRFTPILAIQGECGWLSSFYRHQLNFIRLWNRLLTMSDDRLTKKIFLWDLEQPNDKNWSHKIKSLLESLDMAVFFRNRIVCNLNTVEEKLRQDFVNGWKERLQNVPKLRTYQTVKNNFQTEKYVTLDIPKYYRSILAQFRCGVLPIRIETGRFKGEALCDRLCTLCSSNSIEDECHFLLHCTAYSKYREILFTSVRFDSIITNVSDLNFPMQTAKFLSSAYTYRQSIIYRKHHA